MHIIRSILFCLILSLTLISSAQDDLPGSVQLDTGLQSDAYILFAPILQRDSYLINRKGALIHQWTSQYETSLTAYLLDNGHLLHVGRIPDPDFEQAGQGGIIEEFDWEGKLVWSYTLPDPSYILHHDIEPLPNGNILLVVWEKIPATRAIELGFNPQRLAAEEETLSPELIAESTIYLDAVLELDPASNEIVWEWRVSDHLVQDFDPNMANYGVIAQEPRRINLNYQDTQSTNDITHVNSIDYNAALDQIILSVRSYSEIWIIDHSQSTEETADSAGDLLYRWGNPEPPQQDNSHKRDLYYPHDARWSDDTSRDSSITIFNNGSRKHEREFSSVLEVMPPLQADGTYGFADNAFESAQIVWSYDGDFFAQNMSAAQVLPDNNMLILDSPQGRIFEITREGVLVWEYINPKYADTDDRPTNRMFRADFYAPDFAGFAGKNLTPKGQLSVEVKPIP